MTSSPVQQRHEHHLNKNLDWAKLLFSAIALWPVTVLLLDTGTVLNDTAGPSGHDSDGNTTVYLASNWSLACYLPPCPFIASPLPSLYFLRKSYTWLIKCAHKKMGPTHEIQKDNEITTSPTESWGPQSPYIGAKDERKLLLKLDRRILPLTALIYVRVLLRRSTLSFSFCCRHGYNFKTDMFEMNFLFLFTVVIARDVRSFLRLAVSLSRPKWVSFL